MMKKLFETEVKNVGGVNGEISSPNRSFHYKCSSPLNPILNTTNPEVLKPILNVLDGVMCMTIKPSFNGQKSKIQEEEAVK